MRKVTFFVLLTFTLCFTKNVVFAQKGKLFIIGGGKRPPSLVNTMVEEAKVKTNGYIVVLPMASAEPDTAAYYSSIQFINVGIEKERIIAYNFQKGLEVSQTAIDSLANAALIYISGGDQNRFMEIVKGNEIEDAIKKCYVNNGTIAGTSAGAAVMSKMMITGDEKRYPDYESTFRHIEADNIILGEGLGLIAGAIIDQHFVKRSRYNRLFSAVIEHPEKLGIGIDESTAIVVNGKEAKVVGESQVILFKGKKSKKPLATKKLGAKGITINILLPGDKFKLKN